MLDSLSPQRRRLVLGVLVLGLALVLVVAAVGVVRLVRPSAPPVPQDQPGPVLLVPGYGGTGTSLEPIRQRLERAGRRAVVVTPVGDGRGDLQAQAQHLGEVARQVQAEAGAASVDVVGYSAGGVVARLWVAEGDGAGVARRVLTLGSPHHGTRVAELGSQLAGGCPEACEQLVPDSSLLRRLNAGDETPSGPVWVTVRTDDDRVVVPVDSAQLDGALNLLVQDSCPGAVVGHPGLPSDPVVLATLTSVLGTSAPSAPTGVRCG